MNYKTLIIALTLLISTQASAILSGYHQSSREIGAILDHPEVSAHLHQQPIIEILRKENGYLIVSKDYEVFIEVIYQETDLIGPPPFTLKIT